MSPVIVSIILPLFGILFAGYLVGYYKLMPANSSEALGQFVFLIALPALAFTKLSTVPVADFFNWPFLAVLGGGMFVTFCLGLFVARTVFKNTLTGQGLHALTAMYSSTGYVGLPIILLAFGDQAMAPGIIGAVITGAVFMPIAIVIIESDRPTDRPKVAASILLSVLKNPVVAATVAGLCVSASSLSLPASVNTVGELLGGAYVPCALFAAGLFISSCKVRGEMAEISSLVMVKLVFHPLVTWWLAYQVIKLDETLSAIAIIQAALPIGVPAFVLAQNYNAFIIRSSAGIVISTVLSVITLSLILVLLGY